MSNAETENSNIVNNILERIDDSLNQAIIYDKEYEKVSLYNTSRTEEAINNCNNCLDRADQLIKEIDNNDMYFNCLKANKDLSDKYFSIKKLRSMIS